MLPSVAGDYADCTRGVRSLSWQHGSMGEAVEPWRHVGRVYTAGQQFLVLDVRLLDAWHGTDEQVDELIELGDRTATIPVGDGAAGIIAVDGSVNDEGWLEVFQQGPDRIAVVQGRGRPYRDVMVRALSYPSGLTQADDAVIEIGSGELALWDSAMDGARWVDANLRHAVAAGCPRMTSRCTSTPRFLPTVF